MNDLPYRPCVGVMLVNADGKVFVGSRIDNKDSGFWQMPQGGVDEGEDLEAAALRELAEETGVRADHVAIIGRTSKSLRYDLPKDFARTLWGGKYRGQEQIWFLARFAGEEADIDLEAHDPPEFCDYRWVNPDELPELIVSFKKRVYRAVLEEFRELI